MCESQIGDMAQLRVINYAVNLFRFCTVFSKIILYKIFLLMLRNRAKESSFSKKFSFFPFYNYHPERSERVVESHLAKKNACSDLLLGAGAG